MNQPTPLELAEVGYQAYGDWAEWKNYRGDPMPRWGELPEPQRLAWVAAAGAMYHAILTPPDGR
jgi:hypothetical protein